MKGFVKLSTIHALPAFYGQWDFKPGPHVPQPLIPVLSVIYFGLHFFCDISLIEVGQTNISFESRLQIWYQ